MGFFKTTLQLSGFDWSDVSENRSAPEVVLLKAGVTAEKSL